MQVLLTSGTNLQSNTGKMSTTPRRKLQARRGGPGAADSSSTTPTSPAFVWASDRSCSQLQHSAHETPVQLQQTSGLHGGSKQEHSSSKQDEQQTNEFKWISDFIYEGSESQQQQQKGMC